VNHEKETVARRVFLVLSPPHPRARARFSIFALHSLDLFTHHTLRFFLFLSFFPNQTAHGQDDHPRSRVFGHHRQRQGENPRQRGHPAGSAAIDLRRKTIRRWPNFSRLQHSKRIHLALGLALERRHHRAVLGRLGEKIQPRQEGLPQMLRSITPESGQLQKEEVRAHEPVARQEEVEVNSTLLRFLEGRVLCN